MTMQGKCALITGANAGLGFAIADRLAAEGCNVVVNGLVSREQMTDGLARLSAGRDINVVYIQADLRDPQQIAAMMAEAARRFGAVDILVNNAVVRHFAPVEDFPAERWDEALPLLLAFQRDHPDHERGETDRLLYDTYLALGLSHINTDKIELGLNYFSLAERLGDLPQEALDYRLWADLYFQGVAYSGVNWAIAGDYWRDLCFVAPFFQDSCARLDAALVGYTFATLFSVFGIAYRYTMWLQRPPTWLYWKRGWQLFLDPRYLPRNLLLWGQRLFNAFGINRFIWRRSARSLTSSLPLKLMVRTLTCGPSLTSKFTLTSFAPAGSGSTVGVTSANS